jgi:hypothetical protein
VNGLASSLCKQKRRKIAPTPQGGPSAESSRAGTTDTAMRSEILPSMETVRPPLARRWPSTEDVSESRTFVDAE